ncbi:MAG: M20/M25/M40 family metallo-hydrolase [Anaerolineae bacterium]|nr:M20/M25/M40 family metallo-hydrolase [Anaerolineae bacterium]
MKNLVDKFFKAINWQKLTDLANEVVEQAITLQQIPAPTFEEQQRAAYLLQRFSELELTNVETDAMHNVYGRLPGANSDSPGVMVVAHTDTVFNAETDLQIRREEGLISGAGLGDNSLGVAGMLGLMQILRQNRLTPERDLWFVATSREEGLGDLDGMRAAYERLRSKINMVINIEGLAFGHLYHAGIAVRRLHITAQTEGGHSWLHFGRPSAIHGIIRLGARIDSLTPAATPRTTYNIGLIEGGQSINSIASTASIWLDMRSEARDNLEALERDIRGFIADLHSDDLQFKVEIVGDRPPGYLSPEHPLIRGALAALANVGIRGTLETGSTDGNVSLAAGCPTVTVGITRGGNAHRLDEYIETAPIAQGLQQLITLTLAAAASS